MKPEGCPIIFSSTGTHVLLTIVADNKLIDVSIKMEVWDRIVDYLYTNVPPPIDKDPMVPRPEEIDLSSFLNFKKDKDV